MKPLQNKYSFIWALLLVAVTCAKGQDSSKHELTLNLNYYMPDNKVPYLKLSAKEKVKRQFIPQQNILTNAYIGEPGMNLLGKVKTDKNGEAIVYIPPTFKTLWDSTGLLKFSAVTEANKIFESTTAEIAISKAKIEIDTTTEEEIRKIIAKVMELKNGEWLPAKDVELRIGIKRSLGNVLVGDEETYTTDSNGTVTADFKRDSMPGDVKGNLTLIAWTDGNEQYGNIAGEKLVNWGIATDIDNSFFDQRALWAGRFRTPIWLLGLASAIIIGVWGVLIYLISQIIKIKRLGKVVSPD